MPEMSLTEAQYDELQRNFESQCFLVCGVGQPAIAGKRGTNKTCCWFRPRGEIEQRKHHPWTIDESQVIQYG
jgi:hypothetical protein